VRVPGRDVLTSAKNPKVAAAVRLKKRALREEARRFLVEGAQAVAEALAEDGRLEALFVTDELDPLAVRARQAGVSVEVASRRVIERLTSTVTPQGIVGVAPFVDVPIDALAAPGCAALLHDVRDPGNAGTIVRSADAAGAAGVVFAGTSVDIYNPKTVRASAGSIFHVPIVRGVGTVEALETLRDRGYSVVAMDAHGEDDLFETDLPAATAFLFGNEAHGLPPRIAALADRRARVPHAGRAESLNLSAAATVCLFEWVRRGRRRDDALESLVAAAAHDLRSPLTAMKGFGYALSKRWDDMTEEQRDVMLRGIAYDADRMDTILRQLVDVARMIAGRFELFPEATDVAAVVRQVADQHGRDPGHPPIAWRGISATALVDAARLRSILHAFIEALVWWGAEGRIEVDGGIAEGTLRLEASRRAGPLDPAAFGSLFDARAPGGGGGSKIGLYVARRVAEAQGGSVRAEQADGRLTFRLELPVTGIGSTGP
jgi:RNA methyltransferase, TrmH family